MKLESLEWQSGYVFKFTFKNGDVKVADLEKLVGSCVDKQALKTARIDKDWGCLEFNEGEVDIEPNTLYRYCK